jgi:hypothetical protein
MPNILLGKWPRGLRRARRNRRHVGSIQGRFAATRT